MLRFKTYTEEEILGAVKRNPYVLQYVKEQTEVICLEAVKQDGYALQYVKKLFSISLLTDFKANFGCPESIIGM